MITKNIDANLSLIQLIKNVFDTVQSDKDVVLEMGKYHSTVYIEEVPLAKRIHFNYVTGDLTKVEVYVIDFKDDETKYEDTVVLEATDTKAIHDFIVQTFGLDGANRLYVDFFNIEHDRLTNPDLDPGNYFRLEKCWNVYFHGFMDERDDIAYVHQRTEIEPGIYEVEVYGEPAILFLWDTHDTHHRPLKGLIVRKGDEKLIADARAKYNTNKAFI